MRASRMHRTAASRIIGSPPMRPTISGPSSSHSPYAGFRTSVGTPANALIAPWQSAGIQMQSVYS